MTQEERDMSFVMYIAASQNIDIKKLDKETIAMKFFAMGWSAKKLMLENEFKEKVSIIVKEMNEGNREEMIQKAFEHGRKLGLSDEEIYKILE